MGAGQLGDPVAKDKARPRIEISLVTLGTGGRNGNLVFAASSARDLTITGLTSPPSRCVETTVNRGVAITLLTTTNSYIWKLQIHLIYIQLPKMPETMHFLPSRRTALLLINITLICYEGFGGSLVPLDRAFALLSSAEPDRFRRHARRLPRCWRAP
jgi:hypothetical protein